jgi:hypothetical protein
MVFQLHKDTVNDYAIFVYIFINKQLSDWASEKTTTN